MNDRLVTLATFDTSVEAHIALNALTEAGIWADLSGENVAHNLWTLSNAISGIQLLVRSGDAERALEVIGPLASVRTGESQISDEELERQALEATPEEGEEPPRERSGERVQTTVTEPSSEPPIDREKYTWRAFWLAWFGFACWPLAILALYTFMRAALSPGELSKMGRIRLWFAGGVMLLAVIPAVMTLAILARLITP